MYLPAQVTASATGSGTASLSGSLTWGGVHPRPVYVVVTRRPRSAAASSTYIPQAVTRRATESPQPHADSISERSPIHPSPPLRPIIRPPGSGSESTSAPFAPSMPHGWESLQVLADESTQVSKSSAFGTEFAELSSMMSCLWSL